MWIIVSFMKHRDPLLVINAAFKKEFIFQYPEAIELCLQHNIQLSEDLVEKLTPEKDEIDGDTRLNILQNLAESLMLQGEYHLATKKFTQAGDKVKI